jgi:hypothetical protein
MALHSLNTIRDLKDPLKQFQIKFTISMVPALALAIAEQKVAGVLNGNFATVDAKTLELRCTSFTYPGTKIGQSSTVIGGFRRKLGTVQNKSGIWNCKITEDQNGAVLNTIQAWCDLIHNPFSGTRLPSVTYVTTCVVDIESADSPRNNKYIPLFKEIYGKNKGRRIWLKGFYPIEYTVGQIDASSSNPVELDVKFNYDWWSETITGLAALGTY